MMDLSVYTVSSSSTTAVLLLEGFQFAVLKPQVPSAGLYCEGWVSCVVVSHGANGIATITLNRPKALNAMDDMMHGTLASVMNRLGRDVNVKAAVITGQGEYYSSGADFGSSSLLDEELSTQSLALRVAATFSPYIEFAKPLICAMNGPSIGYATTSAVLCDRIIATNETTMHTPFVALGLSPEGCSTLTFPRASPDAAEVMLGNGELVGAHRGLELGLIHEIVETTPGTDTATRNAAVVARAQDIAARWVAEGRQTWRSGERPNLQQVNAAESMSFAQCMQRPKFMEVQASQRVRSTASMALPTVQVLEFAGFDRLPDGEISDVGFSRIDMDMFLNTIKEAEGSIVDEGASKVVAVRQPRIVVLPLLGAQKTLHGQNVSDMTITGLLMERILALLHRLLEAPDDGDPVLLVVLTEGVEGPVPQMGIPALNAVWGLLRTARLEVPSQRLRIACIDIVGGSNSLAKTLLREWTLFQKDDGAAMEIAYRGKDRLERRLRLSSEHLVRHHVSKREDLVAPLGVVVITGGLGGLGLVTAEACLELGARVTVLVSRSGSVKYAGQALDERLQQLMRRQQADGIVVQIEKCDVGVENDVSALLDRIRQTHGSVDSVVHAAGVLDDKVLAAQDGESMQRVFGPKAAGAWWLHKHTARDKLGVFVTFSSVAALMGNHGQGNYSAANAYLDGLVRWRRLQGLAGTSIQWCGVSGVGMAAAMAERVAIDARLTVDARMAKRVLMQVLSRGSKCEAVQSIVPRAMIEIGALPPELSTLVSEVSIARPGKSRGGKQRRQRRPLHGHGNGHALAASSTWSAAAVRNEVEAAVQRLLGDGEQDFIDDDTPLMEMGMDSLGATELVRDLSGRFELQLPPTLLFNYSTVEALSTHVYGKVGNATSVNEGETELQVRRIKPVSGASDDPVAIVGMSCRFPGGAETQERYWELIREGRSTSSTVPFERWDKDAEAAKHPNMSVEVRQRTFHGSFLTDLFMFDSGFFKISPAETAVMDPQQRLLLEGTHAALTDAGLTREGVRGLACGVYVGIAAGNTGPSGARNANSVYAANSGSLATAAGRISFVFDLRGPCSAYDTACSASFVALHAAVADLRRGECDMAIVAGVNALLNVDVFTAFGTAGMTSPTGQSHTFDAAADGYLRGEGCGVVVLQRTGDVKHAASGGGAYVLVHGVRVASDGRSATLTAPNGLAQEQLLRDTLRDAEMAPYEVDYMEAHGTGTALGDPIEMGAITNVLLRDREVGKPLVMGGVKANIGHLEAAAAISGLIKAVLVLQHEQAPPNAALREMNPKITQVVGEHPVLFPRQLTDLRRACNVAQDKRLVAGVSSFGYAGTITHALISQQEQSLQRPAQDAQRSDDGMVASGVMFLFTGQGSQYVSMGRGLYMTEPVFRAAMDRCDAVHAAETGGRSLLELLTYSPGSTAQ